LRKRYHAWLDARARQWSPTELQAPAIVIAPHQDDETLGCGATIAAKTAAGAPVTIVFMTDGATSHAKFIDPNELRALRRQEAIDAAGVLGVSSGDVHFLDFPDGNLTGCKDAAVQALRQVLLEHPAEQVFIPYGRDRLADHVATHEIFHQSVDGSARHFSVFEYPVWFWHSWPWVDLSSRGLRRRMVQARDALRWGWAIRFQLRAYATTPDARTLKCRALECHRTQTSRWNDDPGWMTLADVAGGDFLSCFESRFEVFLHKTI
jgi:LmbE family N-acetylglucosaminyl deacetylase